MQGAVLPFPISGDTSVSQREDLQKLLVDTLLESGEELIAGLDRRAADVLLLANKKLQAEITDALAQVILRNTASDKYRDEIVESRREYPRSYVMRPVEAQVTDLRSIFPSLGPCMEKLARRAIPAGPEAWFAIPRWQAVARTYGEAVELALDALARRRRFSHRIQGRTGPEHLRQSERALLAESALAAQQPHQDIYVVAAQFGRRHRGASARRARVAMASHEFGLGVFAVACMLLTHPERLANDQTLMVDCSGDEYSIRGDSTFDRVPLFDFDLSGIEFSIFYEDRAWNIWGTPSGFLYRTS
ncbi:MAG TPA: hypothetical protein VN151_09400 [Terracidiphilus sp.]|nr:hypothetical protein [Terracidiphilus sp.]